MKRILFVAKVVKLHINHFHLPYFKWLKENGYEVHVCAKNDFEPESACEIPYCDVFYHVPFQEKPWSKDNYKAYREIRRVVDENHYDIIHCHTAIGGAIGRLVGKKARQRGTKVLYTAHGFSFYKGAPLKSWLVYYPIEYFLSKYTDVLITINDEDYEISQRMKGLKNVKVEGVGIDLKLPDLKHDKKRALKEQLKIRKDDVVLLSVGELNENKNHETVIQAVAMMKDERIKYFICGQGKLEKYLEKLIEELDVVNQVKLLGYRKDIKDLLQISDCFIFPSFYEGLPVALMEAMLAGKSVICSDIRGNQDLIEHEKGGYLVASNNPSEYKVYIDKMMQSKNHAFGVYNQEQVQHYGLEQCVEKMSIIYDEVMNEEKEKC